MYTDGKRMKVEIHLRSKSFRAYHISHLADVFTHFGRYLFVLLCVLVLFFVASSSFSFYEDIERRKQYNASRKQTHKAHGWSSEK